MAGRSVSGKELGRYVEAGRPALVVGGRGDFLWHFSRAYDGYLGVVERLGCTEKLVSFREFSGASARGEVDSDDDYGGYLSRLGDGVGGVVDAPVGADDVSAGNGSGSSGLFAVDDACDGARSGAFNGKLGLDAGRVAGVVSGAASVFCGDDVSLGASVGSCVPPVVEREKKKKRGKNQRDREKYVQAIKAASWRKDEGRKDEKSDLRVSLEKKWAAQNELAAEKARKDLEYQKARDVDAEARKSRARLMKETESSKVATEKAFAFLKSTGNVAGFCETVVSDGSSPGLTDGSSPGGSVPGCTISPDSSASMHEFREAQKKIADQEFQIKKLTRQLEIGKLNAGEEATFTVHSDGEVSDDVKEAIANNKTDFFDVDTNDDGFEDEKPRTLYAKRVAIPGADEYLYDNY